MDAGILFIKDLAVVMIVAGVVGWIFQRLGLSVVVGYLLAGIIIGPFTPPFPLVADTARIEILAQVGLVFLIFSIGLGLSFGRIQRLGISVAGATVIGAILVLNICRLFGLMMGWSATQSLFLAGMLMVSSSAIISKVLEELNATHHRSAQMALGITVLEDVVAIMMLTLLTSLVRLDTAEGATLWGTLGALSAFVVFLVFVALLTLPRLLRYLSRKSSPELRTIVVAACVLLVGYIGVRAGFSVALGAFILGVVIAGTRFQDEIERTFESLRSIFGAVFFVAIGMMLDVRLLVQNWWLVLLTTVLVLVARPLATSLGLIAMGNSVRDAVKAGLALTPIGEFSFVIAQLGVSSGAVPESMYAVAVGLSLTTSVIAPMLTRHSEAMSRWVERHEPRVIRNWTEFYHDWLEGLAGRRDASVLWRLTSKRVVQTGLQILFASALVLFATPIYRWLLGRMGPDWLIANGTIIAFWTVFGVVLLAPLIAIWRNIDALAMIVAEGATRTSARRNRLRPLIQTAMKTVAAVVLSVWLLVLLPFGASLLWALGIVAGILAVLGAVFWRRFVRWHSRLEIEIRNRLRLAATPATAKGIPESLVERKGWDLKIDEVALPPQSDYAGKRIRDLELRKRFGCSIVGIDRQGHLIANPAASDALFPGDKLLLLGAEGQLAEAEEFLRKTDEVVNPETFEDLTTEMIEVPAGSPQIGKTLAELNLVNQFGVQVCGIERGQERILIPSGAERIAAGDQLFVLGTHNKIQECRGYFDPIA